MLAQCCGRYLDGEAAPTAEALMRSRYTAFALRDEDYLFRTWHPRTRPAPPYWVEGTQWTGLTILGAEAGGAFRRGGNRHVCGVLARCADG